MSVISPERIQRYLSQEYGPVHNLDSLMMQRVLRVVKHVVDFYESYGADREIELFNLRGELAYLKEGKPFLPAGTCVAEGLEEELVKGHQLSAEEARLLLVDHIWRMVHYWNGEATADRLGALEGLAHSILVALDGENAALPSYHVIPRSVPEDINFLRAHGENWHPIFNIDHPYDLGGTLHDTFWAIRKE